MLTRMPGWVIDNDASVREEVAPYVNATAAECIEATRRCCQGAMTILRFHSHPAAILAHVDPLPASTVEALARLRASASR